MSKDAMDMLMGSGGTSATFPTIGTKYMGHVVAMEKRQQRDLKGNKKFWDDGEPMWQIVFTLDTGVIDPSVKDDDGYRNVYAKAQMLQAIRDAVKKSGWKGDVVGGSLGVKYVADGQSTNPGFNPPKVYQAVYEAPSQTDALDEVADREEYDQTMSGAEAAEIMSEQREYDESPF